MRSALTSEDARAIMKKFIIYTRKRLQLPIRRADECNS